jgi:hypothetical protein
MWLKRYISCFVDCFNFLSKLTLSLLLNQRLNLRKLMSLASKKIELVHKAALITRRELEVIKNSDNHIKY